VLWIILFWQRVYVSRVLGKLDLKQVVSTPFGPIELEIPVAENDIRALGHALKMLKQFAEFDLVEFHKIGLQSERMRSRSSRRVYTRNTRVRRPRSTGRELERQEHQHHNAGYKRDVDQIARLSHGA
jgi:hypothetical protein